MPATVLMFPEVSTFRMRWLKVSARKRFPEESNAIPSGCLNSASVAGPPSPENPDDALPATVLMTPEVSTLRIRLLSLSAI